jgi:hypothetical protein
MTVLMSYFKKMRLRLVRSNTRFSITSSKEHETKNIRLSINLKYQCCGQANDLWMSTVRTPKVDPYFNGLLTKDSSSPDVQHTKSILEIIFFLNKSSLTLLVEVVDS